MKMVNFTLTKLISYNMVEMEQTKTSVKENIVSLFSELNIKFEEIHHRPVFTMEEAEAECGHRTEEGIKTLALKYEGGLALAVLRADHRLDFKAAASVLNIKKVKMASSEDLKTINVETGGLAPFGYLTKLDVLYDYSINSENTVYINPGVNNITFKLRSEDLAKAVNYWAKTVRKLL